MRGGGLGGEVLASWLSKFEGRLQGVRFNI